METTLPRENMRNDVEHGGICLTLLALTSGCCVVSSVLHGAPPTSVALMRGLLLGLWLATISDGRLTTSRLSMALLSGCFFWTQLAVDVVAPLTCLATITVLCWVLLPPQFATLRVKGRATFSTKYLLLCMVLFPLLHSMSTQTDTANPSLYVWLILTLVGISSVALFPSSRNAPRAIRGLTLAFTACGLGAFLVHKEELAAAPLLFSATGVCLGVCLAWACNRPMTMKPSQPVHA